MELLDRDFRDLVSYMRQNYGINLEKKRNLVEGRLHNFIRESSFSDYRSYFRCVFDDKTGTETANLVNRLTTNHTYFLREPEHFDFMKSDVLPALREQIRDNDLRIWSAGCSSGEEPYTLTMLLHDFFSFDIKKWDTKLLATDISGKALTKARAGIYPNDSLKDVPASWMKRFFKDVDGTRSVVKEAIRDNVIFRKYNLMQERFLFRKRFHVIFCRNVMIYFDKPTKEALVRRMFDVLEPGGYLMIGHAETLDRQGSGFSYVRPAIYRKNLY